MLDATSGRIMFKCACPDEGSRCDTSLRSDRPKEIAVGNTIVLRPTCDKHKKLILELTSGHPQLLLTAGQYLKRAFETRAKSDIDLAETALEQLYDFAHEQYALVKEASRQSMLQTMLMVDKPTPTSSPARSTSTSVAVTPVSTPVPYTTTSAVNELKEDLVDARTEIQELKAELKMVKDVLVEGFKMLSLRINEMKPAEPVPALPAPANAKGRTANTSNIGNLLSTAANALMGSSSNRDDQ